MRRTLLLGVAVSLSIVLLTTLGSGGFTGTDQRAVSEIDERAPDYERWASHVWTPPGPVGEPLLFGLQGGIGAVVFGYYLNRLRTTSDAPDT